MRVNALFESSGAPPSALHTTFLTSSLSQLLQLHLDGSGFVFPVLTATKALETRNVIKLSGCSFLEIPLPLLARVHVEELVADLHQRAVRVTTPDESSVAHALS